MLACVLSDYVYSRFTSTMHTLCHLADVLDVFDFVSVLMARKCSYRQILCMEGSGNYRPAAKDYLQVYVYAAMHANNVSSLIIRASKASQTRTVR